MNPQRLNQLTRADLLDWLKSALLGVIELPKLTQDEPPFAAILQLEPEMDPITRRDLRWACEALVREFTADGSGSDEYVRGLLAVASRLECRACANDLARLAAQPDLAPRRLRLALEGLNMLGAPQPIAFWRDILRRDPRELAVPALKGLLLTDWHAGLAFLSDMPDEPIIASAAASLIHRAFKNSRPEDRPTFIRYLRRALDRCPNSLREPLDDILRRHDPAAHRARHSAPARNPRLGEAIERVRGQQPIARLSRAAALEDAAA